MAAARIAYCQGCPSARARGMAEPRMAPIAAGPAPMADYTSAGKAYLPAGQLAAWGQGIALVTHQLAP